MPQFPGFLRNRQLFMMPTGQVLVHGGLLDRPYARVAEADGAWAATLDTTDTRIPVILLPDGKILERRLVDFASYYVTRKLADGSADASFQESYEPTSTIAENLPMAAISLPNGQTVTADGYRLTWRNANGTIARGWEVRQAFPEKDSNYGGADSMPCAPGEWRHSRRPSRRGAVWP